MEFKIGDWIQLKNNNKKIGKIKDYINDNVVTVKGHNFSCLYDIDMLEPLNLKNGKIINVILKSTSHWMFEVLKGEYLTSHKRACKISNNYRDTHNYIDDDNEVSMLWYAEEYEINEFEHRFSNYGVEIPSKIENKQTTDVDKFKQIVEELTSIYEAKNADYGDSFSKMFEEFGLISSVIRLSDKINRLKTLIKNDVKVKDESIEDSLKDLANYAILTLIELSKK